MAVRCSTRTSSISLRLTSDRTVCGQMLYAVGIASDRSMNKDTMGLAHQFYFFLVLVFSIEALGLILPFPNSTSISIGETGLVCFPKKFIITRAPTIADCQLAIDQLPKVVDWGIFHNGDPDDPFRLPIEKTLGSCTVSVQMEHQGSSREAYWWPMITAGTSRLAEVCLISRSTYYRGTGGVLTLGRHSRIMARIELSRDRVL